MITHDTTKIQIQTGGDTEIRHNSEFTEKTLSANDISNREDTTFLDAYTQRLRKYSLGDLETSME